MKSFKLIIAGIVLAIVVFFTLFILEMAKTPKLAEQKHEHEKIISEAKVAKKKLEKFRKDITELNNLDSYVKTMVLPDEAAVLGVIKEASLLAGKDGLKDPEIYYINPDRPASAMQGGSINLNADLARSMGLAKSKAVFVSLKFKGGFVSLLNYLKDVYALKAAFSVEKVSIDRDDAILPLQNMYLLLALYMY